MNVAKALAVLATRSSTSGGDGWRRDAGEYARASVRPVQGHRDAGLMRGWCQTGSGSSCSAGPGLSRSRDRCEPMHNHVAFVVTAPRTLELRSGTPLRSSDPVWHQPRITPASRCPWTGRSRNALAYSPASRRQPRRPPGRRTCRKKLRAPCDIHLAEFVARPVCEDPAVDVQIAGQLSSVSALILPSCRPAVAVTI